MTDRENAVNRCGKIALSISKDINGHYTLTLRLSFSLFLANMFYTHVIASQNLVYQPALSLLPVKYYF